MKQNMEERIVEALRGVQDPELQQDLVTLGMVGRVDVEGDRASLLINLTTPACPMRAEIEAGIRQALAAIPGLRTVELEFGSQVRGPEKEVLPGVKHIISVGSGKGGVGKSSIAANIAASLALEGVSVGLLDADIYGPSQGRMYGIEGKRLMADQEKRILPLTSHGVRVISIANLVEEGQALTWRGPILHGTLTQMLQQTLWGELDYLIVDMPPGTGDVQLSLTQLVPLTGAVVVTTPQDVALLDVRRALSMLRKTHVPLLGVVENMSWYELPDGTRDPIFGEGGAARLAAEEKIPLLGQIPIVTRLREAADSGTPVVISDPDLPASIALRRLSRILAGQISMQSQMSLPMA